MQKLDYPKRKGLVQILEVEDDESKNEGKVSSRTYVTVGYVSKTFGITRNRAESYFLRNHPNFGFSDKSSRDISKRFFSVAIVSAERKHTEKSIDTIVLLEGTAPYRRKIIVEMIWEIGCAILKLRKLVHKLALLERIVEIAYEESEELLMHSEVELFRGLCIPTDSFLVSDVFKPYCRMVRNCRGEIKGVLKELIEKKVLVINGGLSAIDGVELNLNRCMPPGAQFWEPKERNQKGAILLQTEPDERLFTSVSALIALNDKREVNDNVFPFPIKSST